MTTPVVNLASDIVILDGDSQSPLSQSLPSPQSVTSGDETSSSSSTPRETNRKKYESHFAYVESQKKYKCAYCKGLLNGTPSSNLGRHLQKCHIGIYEKEFNKPGCSKTPNTQLSIQSYLRVTADRPLTQDEFEKRLVEFIIITDQPFSIVEDPSFQRLFAYSNFHSIIPGRNAIRSRITAMFENEKESLKQTLQEFKGKLSFVLDCWTSPNHFSFHGIIARWITDDWVLKEMVLDMDILHGHHTGEYLANSLMAVLDDYGILEKVLGVTSDNASNCDTLFAAFEKMMNERGIPFSSDNQRVRCLAHVLNLACQDALLCLKSIADEGELMDESSYEMDEYEEEDVDTAPQVGNGVQLSIYSRLRKSLKTIGSGSSILLLESFKKQCEISKVKYRSLTCDVVTRWNSTYFMIKRAVQMQLPLENTLRNEKLTHLILNHDEWKLVREILLFLKPFKKMTLYLSCNAGPNMSIGAAVYIHLYAHLEKYTKANGFRDEIIDAATKACDKLNKYYPKTDGLVYVTGTILDPRTKFALFKNKETHFPPRVLNSYRTQIRNCWSANYKPKPHNSDATVEPPQKKKKSTPSDFLSAETGASKLNKKDELQTYLDLPVFTENADSSSTKSSSLDWWRNQSHVSPNIALMARDFLAVSATGVPIERFFSNGPDLLPPKRRLMKDVTVKMCMCLKTWLKARNKEEYDKFVSEMLELRVFDKR